MKQFVDKYWKTVLFFVVIGLVGGFFTGLYILDSYPAELRRELLSQGITRPILGLITAVQSAGYGLVCGVLGILLGKKTGLWKDERTITQQPLVAAVVVAVVGGLALILLDILYFGRFNQTIMDSYASKPTVAYMLAAVIYGGVIEEVMLRLFAMSLTTFLLHKLFGKKTEKPMTGILVTANVVAALLFAAGHLPTTQQMFGEITPMTLLRCFLLNGAAGLAFGYLYRRYGIQYSIMAHAGAHIVWKIIWVIFI
jgi:membrane protease YdiL (CAAX protease family)